MDISFSKRYAFIPFKFHFMFFVSCFVLIFGYFWPGPAISMACLRRLSEFGHARGDLWGTPLGTGKRRKKRRSEDCGLTEAHNGDHFDHYVLTKDWMHWFYVFFVDFFWICKQWKPCWKRLFEIRTVIRFSFKNSPKGDQEVEPEHGRWDQQIDWLFFFRCLCQLCRVWMWIHFRWPIPRWIWPCDCFEKLLRSTAQWWFKNLIHDSQHDLIHVFNILLKKCLDKFCVFVNQVRSMVLEVFYNWRRCLWSQGRKVRENIFLVFQLTTFRCVFFLCFYERFEFRHP